MKIRGTPIDSLADIIQSLQLARKSGTLTAELDVPGSFSELGTVKFRDGQITDASIGQMRGTEALRQLAGWKNCRFIFVVASQNPVPPPAQKPVTAEHRSNETAYTPPSLLAYRSPYLQGAIPDFQRFGLSRTHRQIFLLIDGKRTPLELARLVGRNPQEVLALLADLERMNLISH